MRDSDEIIRHIEEDEYYPKTGKHQENMEDDEPAQYQFFSKMR